MSKIKNSALDQYGDDPFEQQQFGTAGVEGVKIGKHNLTEVQDIISLILLSTVFFL